MLRRHLGTILVVGIFVISSLSSAQVGASFRMGKFTIRVDLQTLLVNGVHPQVPPSFSPSKPRQLQGKVFAGRGRTTLHGTSVNITFSNVQLKIEQGILMATTGTVTGQKGPDVNYNLEALTVRIGRPSIQITPGSARAGTSVTVPTAFFAPLTSNVVLVSHASSIAPDGSLNGTFRVLAAVSLPLKDSAYSLQLRTTDAQLVRAGPAFSVHGKHPLSGIQLRGAASRRTAQLFSFEGSVSADGKKAGFSLDLQTPTLAYPEYGYMIALNRGHVALKYSTAKLEDLHGSFYADLQIPIGQNQAIGIPGVTLETDKTDALSGKVNLVSKLGLGRKFSLEAAADGVVAYFPKWPFQPSNSSYPDKPTCDSLLEFLRGPDKPGLTVIAGILHFDAPQVKTNRADPHKLKVPVEGAITLTYWGLIGNLRGTGYSFIPEDDPDVTAGATANVLPRATWRQILDAGATHPNEPHERFHLADMRVLDMQVTQMRVCTLSTKCPQTTFRYTVHFPFPSFVDLVFEDKTLDENGFFSHAEGPIATGSISPTPEQIAANDVNSLLKDPTPNPDTYILWAWRLPVSFVDRGVIIDYASGSEPPFSTNISVKMGTPNSTAEISSSELWLKPLYSGNSLVKSGIRFSAAMNSQTGEFHLTGWDQNPFMLRMYAKPGQERSAGFAVNLRGPSQQGILLVDPATDPTKRTADFEWTGSVQFPFFSDSATGTWNDLSFTVKDLVPALAGPLTLEKGPRGKTDCSIGTAVGSCTPLALSGPRMRASAAQFSYFPDSNTFTSNNVKAFDVSDSPPDLDLRAQSLSMSSYVNGIVLLDAVQSAEPYQVGEGTYPDECGRTPGKTVRRMLTDWVPSKSVRELACYDALATCLRGNCGSCSQDYIYGKYEVRTRECSTLGQCPETTIMSVPNAKYFPGTNRLDINGSAATMQSDELAESQPIVINIPSAQFAFSGDGRFMEGAFGATLSTVAESLPYEGELRFKLDNHCGYYYFQGAGSFTYFARFSAQTFVIHAPYSFLSEGTIFPGVSHILEDLRIRALFDNVDDFKDAAGLVDIGQNTIITGLFTSGSVSKGVNLGIASASAALGPAAYLYQFKDASGPRYKIGTFVKVRADAMVGISPVDVEVKGDALLPDASFVTTASKVTSLADLREVFNKGEFDIGGKVRLEGCASAWLAHCAGCISFGASYSTKSGFDFVSPDLCGDCGSGGCDGMGKCGD